MLNPIANGKIQGLYKVFECFSSTFQGKFYFQGIFKIVLYIQVLFKPVRTLSYKCIVSSFRASPEGYNMKVSKGAKIRNRYNQVPHL